MVIFTPVIDAWVAGRGETLGGVAVAGGGGCVRTACCGLDGGLGELDAGLASDAVAEAVGEAVVAADAVAVAAGEAEPVADGMAEAETDGVAEAGTG